MSRATQTVQEAVADNVHVVDAAVPDDTPGPVSHSTALFQLTALTTVRFSLWPLGGISMLFAAGGSSLRASQLFTWTTSTTSLWSMLTPTSRRPLEWHSYPSTIVGS